jgi:hypothetical protein
MLISSSIFLFELSGFGLVFPGKDQPNFARSLSGVARRHLLRRQLGFGPIKPEPEALHWPRHRAFSYTIRHAALLLALTYPPKFTRKEPRIQVRIEIMFPLYRFR